MPPLPLQQQLLLMVVAKADTVGKALFNVKAEYQSLAASASPFGFITQQSHHSLIIISEDIALQAGLSWRQNFIAWLSSMNFLESCATISIGQSIRLKHMGLKRQQDPAYLYAELCAASTEHFPLFCDCLQWPSFCSVGVSSLQQTWAGQAHT